MPFIREEISSEILKGKILFIFFDDTIHYYRFNKEEKNVTRLVIQQNKLLEGIKESKLDHLTCILNLFNNKYYISSTKFDTFINNISNHNYQVVDDTIYSKKDITYNYNNPDFPLSYKDVKDKVKEEYINENINYYASHRNEILYTFREEYIDYQKKELINQIKSHKSKLEKDSDVLDTLFKDIGGSEINIQNKVLTYKIILGYSKDSKKVKYSYIRGNNWVHNFLSEMVKDNNTFNNIFITRLNDKPKIGNMKYLTTYVNNNFQNIDWKKYSIEHLSIDNIIDNL